MDSLAIFCAYRMILELLSLRLNLNWSVAAATFGARAPLFPPRRKSFNSADSEKKLSLRLRSETNSSLQSLFLLAKKEEKEKNRLNLRKGEKTVRGNVASFAPLVCLDILLTSRNFFEVSLHTESCITLYQRWKFCYEFVGDGRKKQPARERFIQLRSAAQHLTQERNNVKLEICLTWFL